MGKQHGSINRAGKVKKQTPKVEPKERIRKLIIGRAKKRKQFQKRMKVIAPDATTADKKKFKANPQGEGKK